MSYYQTVQSLKDLADKWRSSRTLLLFIVFVALFLDNMLLTTVGKSIGLVPRLSSLLAPCRLS